MRESFVEENCLFFLNEEENSHRQHELFIEYSRILENRLEQFLREYSLAPEILAHALEFARNSSEFRDVSDLLDSEDDFQKFKKWGTGN